MKQQIQDDSIRWVLLGIFLVFTVTLIQNSEAVSFSFDSQINISGDPVTSQEPQVISSGNNVYVVWRDGTSSSDIAFSRSTDNGQNFGTPISLNSSSVISQNPKITTEGGDVYVVWREGSTSSEIGFTRSDNSGASFQSAVVLSNSSPQSSTSPIIDSTSSGDVSVIWVQDSDIFFTNSTDNGQNFGTPLNLNSSSALSSSPALTIDNGNIFVVWRELNEIAFIKSTDNGDTFDSALTISNSDGVSQNPYIAFESSNVYVIWHNGTDILFAKSANSGSTFATPIDIGDTGSTSSPNPKIAIDGTNVYAVWRQSILGQNEISFSKSSDSGDSFSIPQNMSDNTGSSIDPQIAASLGNVTIAWRDNTDGDTEIFFRASDDSGSTFGNTKNLSDNTSISTTPSIALDSTNAHIVWDESSAGNREIFYVSGTPSVITITMNQTGSPQFLLNDVVEISVNDDASNLQSTSAESITVNVNSDADSSGINLSLNETGINTGIFNGTFTFDRVTSSEIDKELFAEAGDTITVTHGGESSTATVFPITIEFKKSGIGFLQFDPGDIVNLEVTNKNQNFDKNTLDTIDVTVTSPIDLTGDVLTLTETGVNTGIFGDLDVELIFMAGTDLVNADSTITVSQEIPSANTDSLIKESTTVFVNSTSNATGITLTLNEDGEDSNFFSGQLTLSSSLTIPGSTIQAVGSDFLSLFSGVVRANTLVIPNSNLEKGAVKVTFPGIETVTATHLTESHSVTVKNTAGPGGGGGGLVRPGLIVNALAGLAGLTAGGGGSGSSAPATSLNQLLTSTVVKLPEQVKEMVVNHDSTTPILPMDPNSFEDFEFPLVIDDQGFILGGFTNTLQTQTLNPDEPVSMTFTIYEAEKIQHFSLYTNLRDVKDSISQSDTQILYNDGKDLKIIDPQGFFSDANISIIEEEDSPVKQVLVEMTFAKGMDTSHIITRSWDPNLHSRDTHILKAFKVESAVPKFVPIPQETEDVQIEELTIQKIPKWVKSNAEWWADEQIDDADFVAGIEHLINKKMMYIPNTETVNSSVTDIPDWVKNNAEWWADNDISDDDFVQAMQWLVSNGVITIE